MEENNSHKSTNEKGKGLRTNKEEHKKHRKNIIAIWSVLGIVVIAVSCYLYFTREKEKSFTVKDYVVMQTQPLKISVNMTYFIKPEMTEGILFLENHLVTWYSNLIEQTDNTPNHTITGHLVFKGIIAVSGKYWRKSIRPGDLVIIEKTNECYIALDRTQLLDEENKYLEKLPKLHTEHFDVFFYKEEIPELERHPLWKKGFFYSDIYVVKLKQGYPFKKIFWMKGDKEESEEGVADKFYKLIQKKLKAKKFYKGEVDGVVGKGTIKSIKEFQKANKLMVNGIVDSKTWGSLIKKSKKK